MLLWAIAFWPVWRWYSLRINDSAESIWGVSALMIAGFFLWRNRNEKKEPGLLIATTLLMGYAVAFPATPPLIRAMIALTVLVLILPLRPKAGVVGLFALSLPIIPSLQFYFGYPLRVVTTQIAAWFLAMQGMEVYAEGTGLMWAGETVWIDAPCSGIKMLWSGLFLTFVLMAFHNVKFLTSLWSTLIAVIVILVGNGLRASLLFYPETRLLELPEWAHPAIGVASFLVTAIAIVFLAAKKRRTRSLTITSPR
jgi:exosortase/archaeosortase family protein